VKPASLIAMLLSALLLSACGGSAPKTVTSAARADGSSRPGSGLQAAFVQVISRVSPDVVQISTPRGLGSGVVFDNHGDVVTNAHVVAGGGPLEITDAHGHSYPANLVGAFVPDDLAVVHAQHALLPAASFGDSSALKVGDIVLALGNPLGLRSSVTNGILSALGRTVPEPNGTVLPNVIQTSASINPGNSGGALVDLSGRVVGIPTLAATDPQLGGGAAPGIGFALPSSVVSDIAGQIVSHGHVVNSHRAFLGVDLATGVSGAAVIAAVARGGPADRAGIVPGEVITSIDGHAIHGPTDVAAVLARLSPGQTARVTIARRDGSHATVKATLGRYPGRG
jgi:putative serine protease PepD